MSVASKWRKGGLILLVGLLCLAFVGRRIYHVLPHSAQASRTIHVLAAASLSEAFQDIAESFKRENPGIQVQMSFAGSQQLALQIEQGAAADVFASADTRWMDEIRKRELLASEPSTFARNALVVITPASNPARINRLQDLARPEVKLVLAADAVPAGRYSREVFARLSRLPGFSADYATAVLSHVVSNEENVKAVVGKIQLNEADAGVCYQSDITPAVAKQVRTLEIPDFSNIVATYPVAVLKNSSNRQEAEKFVRWVLSAEAQRVLREHHFTSVSAP